MTTTFRSSGEFLKDTKRSLFELAVKVQPTSSAAIQHSTLDKDLEGVKDWLEQGQPSLLHLSLIELEQLEELRQRLHEAGRRIRCDWHEDGKVAIFRMPSAVHEAPREWIGLEYEWLGKQLESVGGCGMPTVRTGGSRELPLPGYGEYQPNNCLELSLWFDYKTVYSLYPRVVLEVVDSQSQAEVENKVIGYLYGSKGHIHLVIIVRMAYPVTLAKDFWATISVWERAETGNVGETVICFLLLVNTNRPCSDEDFPLAEELRHIPHKPRENICDSLRDPVPPQNQVNEEPGPPPASSFATCVSGNTTKVETLEVGEHVENKGIVQRWVKERFFDETCNKTGPRPTSPKHLEDLEDCLPLRVYDFFHVCPQHEELFVPNDALMLSLEPLRADIHSALQRQRMQISRRSGLEGQSAVSAEVSAAEPGSAPPRKRPAW
ncbi:hypothetical protein FRC07_013552, partial [Ceratobasidium sp. 392]